MWTHLKEFENTVSKSQRHRISQPGSPRFPPGRTLSVTEKVRSRNGWLSLILYFFSLQFRNDKICSVKVWHSHRLNRPDFLDDIDSPRRRATMFGHGHTFTVPSIKTIAPLEKVSNYHDTL
jgi:hypothetical protein